MSDENKTPSMLAITGYLLNTKAKTTKTLDRIRLRCFCKFTFKIDDIFSADWSKLSKEKILNFVEYKRETVKFVTANNYLTTLKMLSKECYQQGAISLKTYNSIQDIKQYKGVSADKGRALSLKEINKIKVAFSNPKSSRDYRNYAMFALAIGCGLRRNEISTLNIEDITGNKAVVNGKGNKSRLTYLSKFTMCAINDWLNQSTRKKGALFVHIAKGDTIKSQRLGIKGVHYSIKEIQEQCKIKRFTTHDLRRTFATTLLHTNTDVFTVQGLLGHSDPMTTKRYDKRGDSEKIKAINSLPF